MKKATAGVMDALSKGINAELASYIFYKRAADKLKNKELADMLLKLAGEEKDHYRILEGEYDSLVRSEKWVTYNDILRKPGLPEPPEEMAEPHKRRIAALGLLDDAEKILKMAITLEEEARDLYRSQVDVVKDPEAVEMYTYLAKFEQGHVNLITGWLKKL